MSWLVRLLGARRTIEIGVYTGYSSLATALALPDNGYVLACDVSEEWTGIAQTHWAKAGVDGKIDLRLAPAAETLKKCIHGGESGTYDFAFIDADKGGYDQYFELCLRLVRRGGVMAFDNMLWGGSVADRSAQDAETRALRELNRKVLSDSRVEASLIAVGDGILLATKR
jgi:caffeoyl-CoA O-methyltransferase